MKATACVHYWRLPEANGPESVGRCSRCGAEKAFKNWLLAGDFITNEDHRAMAS